LSVDEHATGGRTPNISTANDAALFMWPFMGMLLFVELDQQP
jgi:hypothetical protein